MKAKVDQFLNRAPLCGALLIGLILISVVSYALETEFKDASIFGHICAVIAVIFAIEYGLRVWSASLHPKGRLGYIFSFYGLIDLLSFLPALLIPAAGGGILLRILRLLRLAQILKIPSVRKGIARLNRALSKAKGDLLISCALSIFLIFIGAVGMYYVEGDVQPAAFGSIPRSLWWSVSTLTTVGYGDVYPTTAMGKVLAAFIAFVGITAVAMPAGILAAAFTNADEDLEEEDMASL